MEGWGWLLRQRGGVFSKILGFALLFFGISTLGPGAELRAAEQSCAGLDDLQFQRFVGLVEQRANQLAPIAGYLRDVGAQTMNEVERQRNQDAFETLLATSSASLVVANGLGVLPGLKTASVTLMNARSIVGNVVSAASIATIQKFAGSLSKGVGGCDLATVDRRPQVQEGAPSLADTLTALNGHFQGATVSKDLSLMVLDFERQTNVYAQGHQLIHDRLLEDLANSANYEDRPEDKDLQDAAIKNKSAFADPVVAQGVLLGQYVKKRTIEIYRHGSKGMLYKSEAKDQAIRRHLGCLKEEINELSKITNMLMAECGQKDLVVFPSWRSDQKPKDGMWAKFTDLFKKDDDQSSDKAK